MLQWQCIYRNTIGVHSTPYGANPDKPEHVAATLARVWTNYKFQASRVSYDPGNLQVPIGCRTVTAE